MTFLFAPSRTILSLAIGLLACPFLGCGSAKPEEEKTPPAPVKWETARLLVLEEWTEVVGTTQPLPHRVALISAPVEGRIVSLLSGSGKSAVVEGQPVHKDEEVAHLDDRILRANRLKLLASVEELKAQISQADWAVQLAQLQVDRLQQLARTSPRTGTNDPDVARTVQNVNLPDARIALASAQAQRQVAEAKLNQAQEDIKALDVQLALYALRAPISGKLGRLRVALGQTVHTGDLVTDVVDLDDQIDVLAFVPPATARLLQIGQSARIGGIDKQAAAAVAGDPEGKVEYIAAQAEAETGNVAVKIRFPNKDSGLHANSTVRVRVLTKPGKECLAIPESALMEDQEPPTVVIVEDAKTEKNKEKPDKEDQLGKARRLQAIIGIRDRVLHQVEILRLEDKEKKWKGDVEHALFVVEKGQGLQTGDDVKLEEEDEEE
jgi:RND family efflux transporter MFP subunit